MSNGTPEENPWVPDLSGKPAWQASPWDPAAIAACLPDLLVFDGPTDEQPDSVTIKQELDLALGRQIEGELRGEVWAILIKGILPRAASEFEKEFTNPGMFPNLPGTCWWVRDDAGTGLYNCTGHCAAPESGEFRPIEPFDPKYFEDLGFQKITAPYLFSYIPDEAVLAHFSEGHTARKSSYKLGDERLWESKLGPAFRILHSLKALEGGHYGDVMEYWEKAY
jgi:hypothetical protein